jgi:hypothetical protein
MSRDGEVLGCRPENSAAVEQWSALPLSKVLHRKPKKKLRHCKSLAAHLFLSLRFNSSISR